MMTIDILIRTDFLKRPLPIKKIRRYYHDQATHISHRNLASNTKDRKYFTL